MKGVELPWFGVVSEVDSALGAGPSMQVVINATLDGRRVFKPGDCIEDKG